MADLDPKLAPCPFCGSRGARLTTNALAGMSWVACHDCGLEAPSETGVSAEDAVGYWNRRARPSPGEVADDADEAYEVANQLGGYVGPDTPEPLSQFLQRESKAAAALADALTTISAERDEARQIVRDIHWMAVRYADGRHSYAPGMLNDALRKGYDAGWLHHKLDGADTPQYARDGSQPEWTDITARLTASEATAERMRVALTDAERVMSKAIYPKPDAPADHPWSVLERIRAELASSEKAE